MSMQEEGSVTFTVQLVGIRPIMFDRYGGDNKTQLDVADKGYLNAKGEYGIPVLNTYSLLAAQNTPSVAKRFYGKQAREMALGVMSFVQIEALGDDPDFAVIVDEAGKPFLNGDPRIRVLKHVARLKDGVPNPKERPSLPIGWRVKFRFTLQDNELLNEAALRKMITQGGILGLGTFRPVFGRYRVEFAD